MTKTHARMSALTYAMKATFSAVVGIAAIDPKHDDDGNLAGAGGNKDIKKFEEWSIKCDEMAESTLKEATQWWNKNSGTVKKDLSEADAAKIFKQINTHIKNLKDKNDNP